MIDEVVVIDAASPDGTADVAERAGAAVWQEAELLPGYGPVLGKGDAMWRALSVLAGELVCFLDADTEGFSAHFATGLLGPLVCEPEVSFVKGFYRRPMQDGAGPERGGGGRVNHPSRPPGARPLLPGARARAPAARRARSRRGASCSSAFPSRPATAWRSRC